MHPINHAILLLAGIGHRMGGLTEDLPKCLLEIQGKSILENLLLSLAKCGIFNAVLVVGYHADKIYDFAGNNFSGIDIEYIYNNRFSETNTAYSLWLAREYLMQSCILLEGDILFETGVLEYILDFSKGLSVWAGIPVNKTNSEGILLRRDKSGFVSGLQHIKPHQHCPIDLSFKCAGIQLLTSIVAQEFLKKLDEAITKNEVGKFADVVLGEVLIKETIVLCSLEGMRWVEIDSPEDFCYAQQMFSPENGKYLQVNLIKRLDDTDKTAGL